MMNSAPAVDRHTMVSPVCETAAPPEPSGGTPLTIVHVVAAAPFGGLESVVASLSAGQTARGHRALVVNVVSPGTERHPFSSALDRAGLPVAELQLHPRAYLDERRRISEICRSEGAQVLHTHGYRPDFIDSGIARRLRIPRVSTVHGFCGQDWKGKLYERLQIRKLRSFDGVIAVAGPQVERLVREGVDPRRIHLLPNAWSQREVLGGPAAREVLRVPSSGFHLGWVGRLSHEKGMDVLLEALCHLRDLPMIVSVIGSGRDREELLAKAEALGVSDRIHWHGSLADAGRYFPAFDAFVLSSRTEGTPMVLFEAMASGVPIVATSVGGVPGVISPEEALLVRSENAAGVANGVRAVFTDPDSARQRATRAHGRLMTEFGSESWLDRHDSIYRRVIHTYEQ